MLKTCVVCGKRSATRRCPQHQLAPRGWQHQKARAILHATTNTCWICNGGPRTDDPFVADHILPRSMGGRDDITNMRLAHTTCHHQRHKGGRVTTG